jgi:two-component system phosphate regulon response regulator PhoB
MGLMRQIDILSTSFLLGGFAPIVQDDLDIRLHRWAGDGALPLIEGQVWAFVDWTLPQFSGLEICRKLRSDPRTIQAHITMILEEDDFDDRRRALRAGADNYMIGPIDRQKALDRVLALQLADFDETMQRKLQFGDLTVNLSASQVQLRGKPIHLTPGEYRLLRFMMDRPGRVFSRLQLIEALGKQEPPIDERTVDVWIGRLRRRLHGAGISLRTVRSRGYVLDPL